MCDAPLSKVTSKIDGWDRVTVKNADKKALTTDTQDSTSMNKQTKRIHTLALFPQQTVLAMLNKQWTETNNVLGRNRPYCLAVVCEHARPAAAFQIISQTLAESEETTSSRKGTERRGQNNRTGALTAGYD